MNTERVQAIINNIVSNYRASAYKAGRKQYPASKKYIQQAEELGILDLIPNAPASKYIGNTEIQLILDAATNDGKVVGGFNEHGEGDVETTDPHPLYVALNEDAITFTNEIEHEADGDANEVHARWGTGCGANVFHLDSEAGVLYEIVFPTGTGRTADATAAAQAKLSEYASAHGYNIVSAWWMSK